MNTIQIGAAKTVIKPRRSRKTFGGGAGMFDFEKEGMEDAETL